MKNTFLSIITQIKTVSAIKWVDEDYGQIDNVEGRPSVKFPCALVSIDEQSEPIGGGDSDVTSFITVRLAHDRLGDRSMMANAEALNATMAKYDNLESLKDALNGFEDTQNNFGPLVYTGTVTERRTDGIAVKALTFKETHEEY